MKSHSSVDRYMQCLTWKVNKFIYIIRNLGNTFLSSRSSSIPTFLVGKMQSLINVSHSTFVLPSAHHRRRLGSVHGSSAHTGGGFFPCRRGCSESPLSLCRSTSVKSFPTFTCSALPTAASNSLGNYSLFSSRFGFFYFFIFIFF